MLILHVIWAIYASVYAVIGEVQRGEHDYSVAVELLLYLDCEVLYSFIGLRNVALEQYGSLAVGKALAVLCTLEQREDQLTVSLVLLCVFDSVKDFLMVYEFFSNR